MNKKYLDDDKKQFIHFQTPELCQQFKNSYLGNIGHTCCNGKGCLLLDVTENKEMHRLKRDFLANKSH